MAESGLRHSTRNRAWGNPPWVRIPPLPFTYEGAEQSRKSKSKITSVFNLVTSNPRGQLAYAMAGACFLGVTQILTVDRLDIPLTGAIWVFALAIPLLILQGLRPPMIRSTQEAPKMDTKEEKSLIWYARSLSLGFLGLAFLFFHFGPIAGILFCIACLSCTGWWLTSHSQRPVSVGKFVLLILLYPRLR